MVLKAHGTDLEQLYTVAEFEQLPEFDERYELTDGRLVEKTVPGGKHALIARRLIQAYDRFDPNGAIGLMLQETSVVLGPRNSPTPDVSFWKAERNVVVTDKAMPLPDLAVEIHSPGDLQSATALAGAMIKVQKLLDAGVPIVWVIYPPQTKVEVYHAGQSYEKGPVQTFTLMDDTLDGEAVIPGFRVALAELFN